MTKENKINIVLPSIVTPTLLSIVFSVGSWINNSTPTEVIPSILGGLGFFSFFTFPLVNLLGWSSYYIMMKLNMFSYTFAFLLAGVWGILFFGLTSDWGKSVNYLATFLTFGVFGMIFLYLARPGKAMW